MRATLKRGKKCVSRKKGKSRYSKRGTKMNRGKVFKSQLKRTKHRKRKSKNSRLLKSKRQRGGATATPDGGAPDGATATPKGAAPEGGGAPPAIEVQLDYFLSENKIYLNEKYITGEKLQEDDLEDYIQFTLLYNEKEIDQLFSQIHIVNGQGNDFKERHTLEELEKLKTLLKEFRKLCDKLLTESKTLPFTPAIKDQFEQILGHDFLPQIEVKIAQPETLSLVMSKAGINVTEVNTVVNTGSKTHAIKTGQTGGSGPKHSDSVGSGPKHSDSVGSGRKILDILRRTRHVKSQHYDSPRVVRITRKPGAEGVDNIGGPPCITFTSEEACPTSRCIWNGKAKNFKCKARNRKPPPPPPSGTGAPPQPPQPPQQNPEQPITLFTPELFKHRFHQERNKRKVKQAEEYRKKVTNFTRDIVEARTAVSRTAAERTQDRVEAARAAVARAAAARKDAAKAAQDEAAAQAMIEHDIVNEQKIKGILKATGTYEATSKVNREIVKFLMEEKKQLNESQIKRIADLGFFFPEDYDRRIALGNETRQVCFKLEDGLGQPTLEARRDEYIKLVSQKGKDFAAHKIQRLNSDNEAIRAVLIAKLHEQSLSEIDKVMPIPLAIDARVSKNTTALSKYVVSFTPGESPSPFEFAVVPNMSGIVLSDNKEQIGEIHNYFYGHVYRAIAENFNKPRQETRLNETDHTFQLTLETDKTYKIYFPDLHNLEYLGIQEAGNEVRRVKIPSFSFVQLPEKNDSTFFLSEVSVDAIEPYFVDSICHILNLYLETRLSLWEVTMANLYFSEEQVNLIHSQVYVHKYNTSDDNMRLLNLEIDYEILRIFCSCTEELDFNTNIIEAIIFRVKTAEFIRQFVPEPKNPKDIRAQLLETLVFLIADESVVSFVVFAHCLGGFILDCETNTERIGLAELFLGILKNQYSGLNDWLQTMYIHCSKNPSSPATEGLPVLPYLSLLKFISDESLAYGLAIISRIIPKQTASGPA